MLYLTKESVNELIIRLNDLSDSVGDEYQFTFEHELQQTKHDCTLVDESLFPYRYSQFYLTLPDDLPNLTKDGEYAVTVKKDGETIWKGKAFVTAATYETKTNDVELGNNKIYEGDR